MDLEALKARLRERRLAEAALRAADLALDGVRLVPGPGPRTRLGGLPDLPPGTAWPDLDGRPLEFVVQVDLAELQAAVPTSRLPPSGLLSFFIDPDLWTSNHGRVLRLDAPSALRREAPPGRPTSRFFGLLKGREPVRVYRACPLGFQHTPTLPDGVGGHTDEDSDAYCDFQSELNAGHRVLGHPYVVQNPMEEECERLTGIPASEWRLLLQIDSDDRNSDMMWGDCGMLYWWIPAGDAPAGRFDRVVTLAQCC